MNICILCSTLRNYAGSERIVYELSRTLSHLGHTISIGCIDIGDFYYNEMSEYLITDGLELLNDEYDIVINLHWPSFFYFFKDGLKSKKIIHFSLSAFEPLESPFKGEDYFDLVICNSCETESQIKLITENINTKVFPNSIRTDNYVPKDRNRKLERIIIVSNHPPEELLDAIPIFIDNGITVDLIGGTKDNCVLINNDTLNQYDLVVTIGYTAVMAMSLKIPVYIYDHFGGDGWIGDNLDENFHYNFSGRPNGIKRTELEIFEDVYFNFSNNLHYVDCYYSHILDKHDIIKNVNKYILSDVNKKYRLIKPLIQYHKIALTYVNLLRANRHIEGMNNICQEKNKVLEDKASALIEKNKVLEDKASTLIEKNEALSYKVTLLDSRKISHFLKKINNRVSDMDFLQKVKFKADVFFFLLKRVVFQIKNRGFKYAFQLILQKRAQALSMLFPRYIKVMESNIDVPFNNTTSCHDFTPGLVSVIIPVYDRCWELKEAIDSILEQSYENIELILITDGSPEKTLAAIAEYENNSKIKVFNYPSSSGNAVRGRNKGILEAKGEFIAFLDSDDISLVERLKTSCDFLIANEDYAGVYGTWIPLIDGTRVVNGVENGTPVFSPDGNLGDHIRHCIPCQSTVMVRASALRAVGGINTNMKYREDHELWARLYANGFKLKSLQEPLVKLRLHKGNNELSFEGDNQYWYKQLLEQYNTKVKLPKKIVWIVAGLGISGGLAIILKHANHLLSKGFDVSLLTMSNDETIDWYDNKVPIYEMSRSKSYILENIDILIATAWNTEQYLSQIPSKRKLYFVQSDERRFMDSKSIQKTITDGYSKDYEYFTEAYWIQKIFHDEFNKQAFYVPNGIDTEMFNRSSVFEAKGEKKRVLIEGPIDIPFKAVEDCYNAVKDLDCEIWFISSAGKPKDSWRYDKFFEKIPMHMMPSLYSSCDIFIKMSRIEGFFGPPLEAMACGCVPVVGKVSGWDEYIVDGYNALAVELKDVKGAKEAVQKLLVDESLRKEILTNSQRTVSEWGWDKSFNRIEQLINK